MSKDKTCTRCRVQAIGYPPPLWGVPTPNGEAMLCSGCWRELSDWIHGKLVRRKLLLRDGVWHLSESGELRPVWRNNPSGLTFVGGKLEEQT